MAGWMCFINLYKKYLHFVCAADTDDRARHPAPLLGTAVQAQVGAYYLGTTEVLCIIALCMLKMF